jgi:hypothetical protein
MNNKQKHSKRPRDINQRAFSTVAIATGQVQGTKLEMTKLPEPTPEERHSAAVMLGSKGGKARASKLTPEQRKGIAKKAAQSRWSAKDL